MSASREEVGARIREIRASRTQEEFGQILGVSRGYLSDIESGRSFPSVPFLTSLAVNIGVPLNWLLAGQMPAAANETTFGRISRVGVSEEESGFAAILNALWDMYHEADEKMRVWMEVQLRRAIPEIDEMAQKKQQSAAAESA